MSRKYTTVLSIAGSDSIGGAGIQADIKSACALGVYAMSVVTAVTAQNTCGVRSYEAVSPELLSLQLEAVMSDVRPDAVKIGMVPDAASARIIAEKLRHYEAANIVVDPVMVATAGQALSSREAVEAMVGELFPLATLVTPNIAEASRLAGIKVDSQLKMMLAAMSIVDSSGARAVLVKGGDLPGGEPQIADILLSKGGQPVEIVHRKVETRHTHGTGCSLSTAIACRLACGSDTESAVREATEWLVGAIDSGKEFRLGKGRGPVNHLYEHPAQKITQQN